MSYEARSESPPIESITLLHCINLVSLIDVMLKLRINNTCFDVLQCFGIHTLNHSKQQDI